MVAWALIATFLGTLISAIFITAFQRLGYLQVLSHTITFQIDPLIIAANFILLTALIGFNIKECTQNEKVCIILILILPCIRSIQQQPAACPSQPTATYPNTELIIQNHIPKQRHIRCLQQLLAWHQLFGNTVSNNNLPQSQQCTGIPIVAAFATLIFYFLVKRLTANAKTSLFASAMLAAAFSYTLYTSGVTKEAFASPLYFTLILLFLLKHNKKTLLAFSLASITLALTHHFTAFFATVILTALSIASYTSKEQKKFEHLKPSLEFNQYNSTVFCLFTHPNSTKLHIKYNVNCRSLPNIIALTLGFVHNSKRHSTRRTFIHYLRLLVAIEIMLIILNVCTLPEARILYATSHNWFTVLG